VSPSESLDGDPLAVRTDLPYVEAKQAVLAAFEQRYLRDLITRAEGNISAAARISGLDRKHLRTLLRRHALIDSADGGDGRDGDDSSDESVGGDSSGEGR
jgi:DNA-binding NtrC family response regulator